MNAAIIESIAPICRRTRPRRGRIRLALVGCLLVLAVGQVVARAAEAPAIKDVLAAYADIAHAGYEDSLITARTLRLAVDALLEEPSEPTMRAARAAWIAARIPYQQTEVFRFGNAVVDDWEGKVNAWPLDEGLVDYVAGNYGEQSETNQLYAANVIANTLLKFSGKTVDASRITKELLSEVLHEAGGVEANVATGYHVIEFLLWGQDLNGTGPGNGNRPATDYSTTNCTGGNCARRAEYLKVATDLLIDELAWMAAQWAPGGKARDDLVNGDPVLGLRAIITGLGSLSYGELAGERMKLGLMLHDPEEEHDCFSDNTHAAHLYDQLGIRNVYVGRYRRVDNSIVAGPSLSDVIRAKAPDLDKELRHKLDTTLARMHDIARRAETVEAYDQMIGEGNEVGNGVVQAAVEALLEQTRALERAVASLELDAIAFERSDSLDVPDKVGR